MVLRKLAVALLSVGVMLPGLGHALAVKDVQTKSALGEPFQAEVELADLGDLNADEIKVSLATQEDFDRLGIERVYFLSDLRFDVIVNQSGRSFIKVSTNKPVREPYLDFVVRIAWPGNVRLQNVTALLDPPVVADSKSATVNQPVTTAPAPVVPVVKTETVAPAPAPTRQPAPEPVVATKPVEKKPVAPAPRVEPVARPATPSSSAGEYRVQAGDTLSRIASKQTGSSSAQALIAIQRANPDAFANGNINQLRRGQVLRIPSDAEIREVNAREASASVQNQMQSWKKSEVAPALTAQQVDATAKTEKPAPAPAASKPEMKLLGAQAGQKAGVATAGTEKTAATADAAKLKENQAKAAAAKAEKEKLTTKVGTLDKQVKANDQQLQVQNAKLAELNEKLKAQQEKEKAEQEKAKKDTAAAAEKAAAKVADDKSAEKAPEVIVPAPAADATKDAAKTPEGVETSAAETKPAIESAPLPEQAKPAPAVIQDESVADEGLPLPLLGGAGAAILALLGGGFWWARKRRQEKEEEEAALAELETDDVDLGNNDFSFGKSNETHEDWGQSAAVEQSSFAVDKAQADPLQEVEQYLAYERYPQAVGFLNKAIAAEPERSDLRMKLLEIYARLDDWNGFVEQEAWFENAGDLDALAHAEELKAGLTPPARKPTADDPLEYERVANNDAPSLEDLEMDFNASVSASSPALQAVQDSDLAFDTELSLDDDFSLDTHFEEPAEISLDEHTETVADAPAEDLAADSGLSLDETLDFSFTEKSEPAPVEQDLRFDLDTDFVGVPADLAVETSAADEGMEFSLEEELPAEDFTPKGGSLGDLVDFDEAPEFKEPEVVVTEDDLSFSLDDLEANTGTTAELEGDFSLDEVATDVSFDDTVQIDSGLNDAAADFDAALNTETVADTASASELAPASSAAGSDNLDLDDEFDFLADSDENATKLDLARAYIDMGDMEGARDILQEVLAEGSASQKEEAKELLTQAG